MHVFYESQRLVHQQMLKEVMQREHIRAESRHKGPRKNRRVMRALALLLVKIGKTLEHLGQTYLIDEQSGT